MEKRKVKKKVIDPFPDTIDRNAFGWYISGFTDGEGCFSLLLDGGIRSERRKQERLTPCASFAINLRKDDDKILKLIQSYFQCGSIVYGGTTNQCTLRFRTISELAVIKYHFSHFMLFAKKKWDFEVWKEGVELLILVSNRKQKRSQRYGSGYKWSINEHALFAFLKEELSTGKKFEEVASEESSVCDTSQSQLLLDSDMRSIANEESTEG